MRVFSAFPIGYIKMKKTGLVWQKLIAIKGGFKWPSIQIEFLVAIVFGALFIFASSNKNKLQS